MLDTGNINVFIISLISGLALWELKTLYDGTHRDLRSIIVSVGVFGTFLGIFLGLQDFNTENISDSVPGLLEGMKLAFLTSVCGLGTSTLLSIIGALSGKEIPSEEHNALIGLELKLQTIINHMRENFDQNHDLLEEIKKDIKESLDQIGKSASEEIIEALNEIIQDFNKNLKEQFGENFKQLNEGVAKLLDWQENYSNQVKDNEQFLLTTIEELEKTKSNLDQSNELIGTVGRSMEEIKEGANIIGSQANLTNEALRAQKKLVEDLESTFERMEKDMNKVSDSISDISNEIKGSLTSQSQAVNQLTNDIKNKLPESLGQLEATLTGLTKQFGQDYERFLLALKNLMERK